MTRPQNGGTLQPSFGTAQDIIGVIFWAVGLFWESWADFSKYYFKSVKKPPPPKGAIITIGPWQFSRRPNYFGEILHWIGIYLVCISPADRSSTGISERGHAALLGTVVSPIFTFALLMFLSGMPTAEKPTQKKYFEMSAKGETLEPYGKQQREEDPWRRYKAFKNRTSLLVPLPPALYKPLPGFVKTWLLLDLPMYQFDEHKDGSKLMEEQRGNEEEGQ